MTKTMRFVIFACISPCVRKRANTERINARLFIKLPLKIGFSAFFSTNKRSVKDIIAAIRTDIKANEFHPKFCPKDGTQSARLKKINTNMEPTQSKSASDLRVVFLSLFNIIQAKNMILESNTHTHIIILHPQRLMSKPPSVGPKMTAALEMSI